DCLHHDFRRAGLEPGDIDLGRPRVFQDVGDKRVASSVHELEAAALGRGGIPGEHQLVPGPDLGAVIDRALERDIRWLGLPELLGVHDFPGRVARYVLDRLDLRLDPGQLGERYLYAVYVDDETRSADNWGRRARRCHVYLPFRLPHAYK